MDIKTIVNRLKTEPKTRFVAFGSSNTERFIHGLHWFDWLDLGYEADLWTCPPLHQCGIRRGYHPGLLSRFDEDVALYQPHVVFITIGGNDANPEKDISAQRITPICSV